MFAVNSEVIRCYFIMPNNEVEILHSNRDSTKTTVFEQPPTLSGVENQDQPKCGDALWLGSKGR